MRTTGIGGLGWLAAAMMAGQGESDKKPNKPKAKLRVIHHGGTFDVGRNHAKRIARTAWRLYRQQQVKHYQRGLISSAPKHLLCHPMTVMMSDRRLRQRRVGAK